MADTIERRRLDAELVRRGLAVTRARARDIILRGEVSVGGRTVDKPALMVAAGDVIALSAGAGDYVSRGSLKLRAALDHFGFDVRGRVALDVGASTGGFTEALLNRGAARVYAIDNGSGQLHPRLASDPRVVSLERTDARGLSRAQVPEPVRAIVADVSFISLTKVLPAALALAAPDCWLAALVKPQFEAEAGQIPRHGVIRDEAVRRAALSRVVTWLGAVPAWAVAGSLTSPIAGGSGNIEYLVGAKHHG